MRYCPFSLTNRFPIRRFEGKSHFQRISNEEFVDPTGSPSSHKFHWWPMLNDFPSGLSAAAGAFLMKLIEPKLIHMSKVLEHRKGTTTTTFE